MVLECWTVDSKPPRRTSDLGGVEMSQQQRLWNLFTGITDPIYGPRQLAMHLCGCSSPVSHEVYVSESLCVLVTVISLPCFEQHGHQCRRPESKNFRQIVNLESHSPEWAPPPHFSDSYTLHRVEGHFLGAWIII